MARQGKRQPDYQAMLQSGRSHATAAEWSQAIADFQAALRAKPKDAVALAELSVALFMTEQLDSAQRAAEQSVKFAMDSSLKAAGLRNLGRIAEARKKESEALKHYYESLKLQQSDETVRRIYQLDPSSEAVPCRSARSIEEICGCLNKLLGGTCVVEDDIQPTVKRLRSSWSPKEVEPGTGSAFLAVQAAGGWFLTSHLGRLRDRKPHHVIITDMKADIRQLGGRQIYKVEYTAFDGDTQCAKLGSGVIKGLDREYEVECLKEERHMLACVSSEDGQSVSCPFFGQLGCKHSKSAHITDEFEGLPKAVRAQVRAWEARSRTSAAGQLSLSDSGTLRGTALAGNVAGGACPKPKSVALRLW